MIVISVYGWGTSIPVELIDTDLDEAKQIVEDMLKHVKTIDWSAEGISITEFKKGFVSEAHIIPFYGKKEDWITHSRREVEDKWKQFRLQMEKK